MEQNINDLIKDAEMVLVGVGEEFSPKCPDFGADKMLEPYLKSRFYAELPEGHEVIAAYNKLREMIGAKPYFVVTMNTDDLIYRSELEQDLIVAPCGSMQKMQCGEHISEAGAIRERVLRAAGVSAENAGKDISEVLQGAAAGEKLQNALQQSVCPICKKPLNFHTIETEGYLEEGYLPQWAKYKKWLQCTLNRKLCVLELGVGFRYPQVVRFPFEKAAAYNQKASLVRIHSKFPQIPEKLSQRGIGVKQSPVQFLLNY